jgi:hypothetical protein
MLFPSPLSYDQVSEEGIGNFCFLLLFSLLRIQCYVLFCDIVILSVTVFLLRVVLFIVLVLCCVCL